MTHSGYTIGQQKSSHEDLIEIVSPPNRPASADTRLDAIIVPASRPAEHLMTAIDLAKAVDCHLVVLCSRNTQPSRVRARFAGRNFTKGTAVEVPRGYIFPGLHLETSEWLRQGPGMDVCGGRDSDLSVKRNIGLLIARMCGWQHIFFIDDDIRGIAAKDLTRTVSALKEGRYRSSGFPVEVSDSASTREGNSYSYTAREEEDFQSSGQRVKITRSASVTVEYFRSSSMQVKNFPDNSVVCHARRQVGEHQDVFVSGSVLAVDCAEPFGFFPDIYNEDWLFFYRDVAERKMASPGVNATKMRQLKYNPFSDPQRAAREEFGDVIAEGLYSLLHHDFGEHCPTKTYWARFLSSRSDILDKVAEQHHLAPPEMHDQMNIAILTARETLDKITPDMCVDYFCTWQRDLLRWGDLRDSLPKMQSVPAALRELKLLPL